MSHEEEVITTGPFDETDEHDYSDHHHHHQQEQEQEQEGGNGWMDNNNDNGKDQQNDNGHQQKQEQEEATRRNLYVSNLSFETTEEILRERFSPFGEIVHIEIVRDPVSKVSR
jgi:RNA recognition motif-containing protein